MLQTDVNDLNGCNGLICWNGLNYLNGLNGLNCYLKGGYHAI